MFVFNANLYFKIFHAGIVIQYKVHSNRRGFLPFPVRKCLALTVDEVPADGVDNTLRLISAIAPESKRYQMI